MTLHEAIIQLLRQTGRSMTTSEIAKQLNQLKWYSKKDGSAILPFQIHGRTRNYPQFFDREGSLVSLRSETGPEKLPSPKQIPTPTNRKIEGEVAMKELLDEANFKSVPASERLIPDLPGVYSIRLKAESQLPPPFQALLKKRGHNLIYIGIASQSLAKRFYQQELRAKGHGTFFRSLGAVLGYRPAKGSLLNKANKRNYKFKPYDEELVTRWIDQHLLINWLAVEGDLEDFETMLIKEHRPLFNLSKNPDALKELSDLRALCVTIANTNK